MTFRLPGLIAAVFTPLDPRGELNESAIDRMADHLAASGVAGVFVCGTTGECHSLSLQQRRRALRRWRTAAGERLKVVAHVGSNCLADAAALAADAAACGADAIGAMAPFFFRPTKVSQLADYLAAIARAAPETPFYYYDIPALTGVALPTDELLRQATERIPSLCGVKFTRNDNMLLQSCLAVDGGRFDILFGHDECLLTGLALGVRGAIGSTYNFAAPLYVRLIEALERGDLAEARRLQQQSVRLVEVLARYGVVRAGKAIMSMRGLDCGPVQLPLEAMTAGETDALRSELEQIGFFGQPFVG